jgi:hypothetical protein
MREGKWGKGRRERRERREEKEREGEGEEGGERSAKRKGSVNATGVYIGVDLLCASRPKLGPKNARLLMMTKEHEMMHHLVGDVRVHLAGVCGIWALFTFLRYYHCCNISY